MKVKDKKTATLTRDTNQNPFLKDDDGIIPNDDTKTMVQIVDEGTISSDVVKTVIIESMEENVLSQVCLLENVFSSAESSDLLQELSKSLEWNVETDTFGRQSRETCYYGDENCVFSYVGLKLQPKEWTEVLQRLRCRVESLCLPCVTQDSASCQHGPLLTACLGNQYLPGEGHIPWHYDEIRAHGPLKVVASLSLGGPRRFFLRKQRPTGSERAAKNEDFVADLMLPPGSVLLMTGNIQENYEHCLPLSGKTDPHRISLTFRSIVPGFESNKVTAEDPCVES